MPAVRKGKKHNTIRLGKRDIEPGLLTFINASDGNDQTKVMVTRVSYCLACQITYADAKDEGLTTPGEVVAVLTKFYPNIKPDSIVTIIRFDQPTE